MLFSLRLSPHQVPNVAIVAATLLRAVVLDELGQPVFKRALWLIVLGERRGELSLLEARQADG